MGFNRFYIRIIIKTLLTAGCIFLFFYFFQIKGQYTTAILFAVAAIIMVFWLIYYVSKTNRILANFLIYLKENDPSLTFSQKTMERTFRGLHLSFQEIIEEFQKTRKDKELQSIFTSKIIENINTGIITYFENGTIDYLNNAALSYLGIKGLARIGDLQRVHPKIASNLSSDNHHFLEKLFVGDRAYELSITKHQLKTVDGNYYIITLHDIRNELDAREIESWKKLIRVINHEIMNSITPITTLTTAIKRNFSDGGSLKEITDIEKEDIEETIDSAEIIEERSKGLIDFIQKYRELTRTPEPQKVSFLIYDVLKSTEKLFAEPLANKKISVKIECAVNLTLYADKKMIEQIMINLLKNSIEAIGTSQQGEIILKAYKTSPKIKIEIIDNGCGISDNELPNVFVPFYTTKEEGSGIGLSLSQQLVRLNGGELRADMKDRKTIFSLSFDC